MRDVGSNPTGTAKCKKREQRNHGEGIKKDIVGAIYVWVMTLVYTKKQEREKNSENILKKYLKNNADVV